MTEKSLGCTKCFILQFNTKLHTKSKFHLCYFSYIKKQKAEKSKKQPLCVGGREGGGMEINTYFN